MKDEILQTVQQQYASVARSGLNNDLESVRSVAQAFGYTAEDLAELPAQANMGLSCGNPVAIAGLRPGEVVLDLGCGGGLDVILASKRVGSTGLAIGVDMTPEMIQRARASADKVQATNVQFHLARVDQLPIEDSSVDCIISNCVINLVPDKGQAFGEMLRVLKPGGRIVLSDIALKQPLPDSVLADIHAYVGCISGAILIDDYARQLAEAGFTSVVVQDTFADLNAYAQAGQASCCSTGSSSAPPIASAVHDGLVQVLQSFDANRYAASVRIHALKPLQVSVTSIPSKGSIMKTIEVYDKPMCCSTGICGADVDQRLVQFAADLQYIQSLGHNVHRYNLAQQPEAYIQNATVHALLSTRGTECLPLILVDDKIVSRGAYPSREMLKVWAAGGAALFEAAPASGDSCCGGSDCC
jgi:ubiquinone/menaquinone biosynthesis C-methylase UbiE